MIPFLYPYGVHTMFSKSFIWNFRYVSWFMVLGKVGEETPIINYPVRLFAFTEKGIIHLRASSVSTKILFVQGAWLI